MSTTAAASEGSLNTPCLDVVELGQQNPDDTDVDLEDDDDVEEDSQDEDGVDSWQEIDHAALMAKLQPLTQVSRESLASLLSFL